MLLFVKREVYCCDCLQFLVHFLFLKYFLLEIVLFISVVSTFCWDGTYIVQY